MSSRKQHSGKKGGGGGGNKPGGSNQPEQQRQQQPQQQQRQPQPQQQQQQQRQPQPQQQQQQQRQPQPQQQQQRQPQQWQQQPQQQQPQQWQQQPQQRQQQPQQQPQQWQQQQQPHQWQQQPQQQQRQQQQQWPQSPQQQPQPPQQQQRQQQQQWPQSPQQQPQPLQQQRTQDAPQDFPPPGAGDFRSKQNRKKGGRQGQALPQQESGAGPGAAPPQQALQQPASPQQYSQEPRMQQSPGFPGGPARQATPFVRPPVMEQQGPSRPAWGQQQQPGPRGGPSSPWEQRGRAPQQVSQSHSRETTPTHQTPLSPQQQPVSPLTEAPPIRQQPTDPQSVRSPPSQPQAQQQTPPQPKSAPGGVSALTEKMRTLQASRSTFIPPKRNDRPADVKKGRVITVETNHLNLTIKNKNMVIYHYDVSISPEKPYRNYRLAVEAVRQRCFKNRFPAFDGKKNLYSYPELPFTKAELVEAVSVYDSERDQQKEMTVTIKYATQVNVSMIWDYLRCGTSTNAPQEAIQALDIVLRQPAANRFVTVGRSFFSPPPGRVIDLGFGLDLWYGFFQSAVIGWKPYVNIDVAHKGFPAADNCVDAMRKFIRGDVGDPHYQFKGFERESYLQYIRDLKIVYEIPAKSVKRTYKVSNITACPRENRFEFTDKETNRKIETTVERYFLTQYGIKLKYPHLPCLTVGTREKPVSLPMELCRIVPGQVTIKKMNDTQTRTMVKEAAVDTERRKQKILKSIDQIRFNEDPCLREFGLSVDDQFTKVKARIMNAPTVEYREKPVPVRQGVWRSEKFINGAELVQWRVVNTNPTVRENELRKLASDLINYGRECGMNISSNYKFAFKESTRDLEQYFSQCLSEEVKLVIVILPDKGTMTYASIKKIAELQVGILTQCLKSITVTRRLNAATFLNILQKINAKLNGINHHITNSFWPEIFKRPVIVVGADVTHPAPDQVNVPSIAAVAASYDPRAFRYNMIWKLQPPREEVIRDLESIMKEQLIMFYKNTNRQKPNAILFYRDGVSEGQFKTILDQELMAIRRACSSLSVDYNPPITFIVVQKRHHTRFFPSDRDADGRNKNVPAGTVVDTEITHPTELDFYLVSHASIQGTARPTKYHLLWDDSNLSEQSLEEITYYLCHLFTRCTRSVSYPAPTYYAHLAAFRARAYTDADRLQLNQLQEEQNRRTVKDSVCKRNPMFFV
ncbi:protein argonaute-2 isoform X1 [Halyomorpha halys]|uniref:protein argonaute-2 isoform X1 n=1 Tax=Halyomorpha halys TaxID=286706 RepID=UPI0034D158AA